MADEAKEVIPEAEEPRPSMDAPEIVEPSPVPPLPQLAEPGIYIWEGDATEHRLLGVLTPGDNDFTGVTHPEMLEAIQQMVDAGDLRKA